MNEYTDILSQARLFRSMEPEEIGAVLGCLSARKENYQKGERIFNAGDITDSLGLILTGSVNLVKEDYWGNRNIIAKLGALETFGEVYACMNRQPLNVTVQAASDTCLFFFNVHRILVTCSSACHFHTRLIQNLLEEIASKAFLLTQKIDHTSKRSTREKLLSYLSEQALQQGSASFNIPFNRQELADYLFVERSAMSAELSRMRQDGLIEYHKNHFTMLFNKDSNPYG